jgi:hypothetical protein
MKKGIVIHLNGGLGKCIMFTAVAKNFKEQNPDTELVIISGYPEVFLHNPNIDKNFGFNHHGLWQEYYSNPDYEVNAWDPYMHQDWISNKKRHLIDIWCEILGIDFLYDKPEMVFSGPEVGELQRMIQVDKPLMIVQSTGGPNPKAMSWTRNPAKGELEELLGKYLDTHYIVHLCVPDTPVLANVHQRLDTLSRRQAMCLVHYSENFIGIDSFALHARAANPDAGPSQFIFPIPETVERLAYTHKSFTYHLPRPEVQEILEKSSAYFATMQKFAIEELSESCPVPVGVKWFEF